MSVKKVLMSKKISNVLYDIYPKTSADIVEYNNTTVAAALGSIATDLEDIYTKSEVNDAIAAVQANLDALIGSDTPLDTAFDTIKEISDWLASGDGSAVSGLISDVSALKTAVGDSTSGLVKDVADLETTVGDSSSGLVKAVADNTTAIGDASSGLTKGVADNATAIGALETAVGDATSGLTKAVADNASDISGLDTRLTTAEGDIDALETTVGDANSGLVKDVADLKAVGSTKVEASSTNGYIKINNVDTQVYDDSAIPAANIAESTTKKFVAETDITNWNSAAHILSSSTGATDNDLIITEIPQS